VKNCVGPIAAAAAAGNSGCMEKPPEFDRQVVVGAIVGVAAALALIGWVLTRI